MSLKRLNPTIDESEARARAQALADARADDLRAKAEIAIERVLIELSNATGRKLDRVDVDTRNFANCNTEIFFEGE